MIPAQLEQLHNEHWKLFSNSYDLTEKEGCGKYTEHWVKYAQQAGFPKVGHLKKHGNQTQYNGHAIDSFLYADGEGNENEKFQSVDIIANAEAKPPYNDNNKPPAPHFGKDIPRYTISDWMKEPNSTNPNPQPDVVPWIPYDENGFQRLKRMIKHDYERRPQGADYDVSVWAGRYFHNHYMGPEGKPLSEMESLKRVKIEMCAALKVPMDDYYGDV